MLAPRTVLPTITAACVLSSLACSHMAQRPTSVAEAEEIIAETGGRPVEIQLLSADGVETRRGVLSPMNAETFQLADPTGSSESLTFAATRSITFTDRRPGAVVGMLLGAAAGGFLGYETGRALEHSCAFQGDENRPCEDVFPHASTQYAWVGGILTAIVGFTVGLVVPQHTTLTF